MTPWRGVGGVVLRFAATLAVVAGVVGLSAGPAAAATSLTINSPAPGAIIRETSNPTLAGQVTADGYVCSIDMKLTANDGQPPPPTPQTSIDLHNQPTHGTTFSWTPSIPANGGYTFGVTVQVFSDPLCSFGASPLTASRTFYLEVAPAPPAGVTATANPDRTVKVSWQKNAEPDLVGYSVFRVAKGQDCPAPVQADRIATTTPSTLTFTDTFGSADPGGDYCYSVEATRKGAKAGTTVDSPPSTAAVATVPAAPNGTSTGGSGTGGAPGSGGAGGTSSGGTTVGSAPAGTAAAAGPGAAPAGGGTIDLGFSSLLEKAQRAAPGSKPAAPAAEPDGGFLPTLPFKKAANPGDSGVTVGDSNANIVGEGDNSDQVRLAGAIAAGLLALVVVGHLLLLRREVNRVPALEPMEPSAGAAGTSG